MDALLGQIGRYASFAAWFFKDAFLRYRGRLVLLVAANVSGVGLQALAVLIAYQYAKAVESGKAMEAAGFVVEPRDSFGLLAAAAVAVFVLAVGAAVLVWRARVEGVRVSLDYAEYCSQRIYFLASRLPAASEPEAIGEYTKQRFVELARRDANYCGLVLRIMTYALHHLGTVVVAGAALVVLDIYLTLVVFAIIAVSALFLRRASIQGASHRSRLQRHAFERSKERRVLDDRVVHSPAPLSLSDPTVRQAFDEGGAAGFRRAMLGQRQALEGGRLIAQIAMGFALFLVLLVQGGATLSQANNWSALLVYIVALTFFGTSIARAARLLVNINRFYPPLARHARFVASAERELSRSDAVDAGTYSLNASMVGASSSELLEMRSGDRLALVLPGDVTRYSMVTLAKALRPVGADSRASRVTFPWFASSGLALGGGTLRENFGLPARCSLEELEAALAPLRAEKPIVKLPSSLDRPLTDAELEAFSPSAIFVLMALSGLLNRRPMLALDQNALAMLEPGVRMSLLETASACITFVAYRVGRIEALGTYGESAVIIAGLEEVLGWTRPELVAGNEAVKRMLDRAAADSREARSAVFEDDELEELG